MLSDAPVVEPLSPTRHAGSRVLQRGNLVVEIMDPAAPDRYHRGVRFTPLAAVLRADYRGQSYFFNPVEHDPATDHAGLAAEFDLVTPPTNFKQAPVGGEFVKVGVGVLRKHEKRYVFHHPYEPVRLARVEAEWGRDRATFRQVCEGTGGYAYRLDATIVLEPASLRVDWRLTNTGEQPLATEQYIHNYFLFADHPAGPGYELEFPYAVRQKKRRPAALRVEGGRVAFVEPLEKPLNFDVAYPEDYDGPNRLTVRHPQARLALEVETSIPGTRTALHASESYVCPEQFVRLELAPGESTSWTRSYRFGQLAGR